MVGRSFIPDRGDIIWISFDQTKGHEQRGKRPALVLSSKLYNVRSGLAVVVPITEHVKGYPFEVAVEAESIRGVILADQLKSIDWQARRTTHAGRARLQIVTEVQEKISALLL